MRRRDREGGSEVRKHVMWKLPWVPLLVFHQFILADHRSPESQQLSVSTEACLNHAFGGAPEPPTAQPSGRGV
jgi:hypothetical protein